MSLTDFITLIKFVGIPGGMTLAALYAIHKGWFITKGSHDAICGQYDARLQDQEQYMEEIKADRKIWRDRALRSLELAEKVAGVGETATNVLVKDNK